MSILTINDEKYAITDLGFNKLLIKTPSSDLLDGITPELKSIIEEGVAPKNIISGELAAALDQVLANLHSGKEAFAITGTGYILGVDPADGKAKFYLGDSTNYLFFDGTTLQITGGTVVGSVAGFVLTATEMTGGNLVIGSSSQRIAWGSGNDILIADADDATYRLWAGNSTAASAPFSVTKAGVVNIDSGTIDGVTIGGSSAAGGTFTTLTATSIVIGANTITTSEWAFLDGLNQSVATTSSPTFNAITATSIIIGANTITTSEWANLDGLNQTLATTSSPTFNAGTFTSIIIGANTITTSEWANLDGLNQTVASTSSPTFVNLTITSFAANWTNAGRTVADGGIFTTLDLNGGTIDGTAIGSSSPSSGIFTSLQADSITNDTGLAAGTYSPTRSAEVNLDANVTTFQSQYLRVGNTVTVSGRFTADPTAAVATSFELDLPVASNIGAVEDLAGVAFSGAIAGQGAQISGSVANNTAVFTWVAVDLTSQSWSYTFTYQVI